MAFQEQVEENCEEQVAGVDRGILAKTGLDADCSTAFGRIVDNVVVDEGCHVEDLDRRR